MYVITIMSAVTTQCHFPHLLPVVVVKSKLFLYPNTNVCIQVQICIQDYNNYGGRVGKMTLCCDSRHYSDHVDTEIMTFECILRAEKR